MLLSSERMESSALPFVFVGVVVNHGAGSPGPPKGFLGGDDNLRAKKVKSQVFSLLHGLM